MSNVCPNGAGATAEALNIDPFKGRVGVLGASTHRRTQGNPTKAGTPFGGPGGSFLCIKQGDGLQCASDGLQPKSDGLQPKSDLQPANSPTETVALAGPLAAQRGVAMARMARPRRPGEMETPEIQPPKVAD